MQLQVRDRVAFGITVMFGAGVVLFAILALANLMEADPGPVIGLGLAAIVSALFGVGYARRIHGVLTLDDHRLGLDSRWTLPRTEIADVRLVTSSRRAAVLEIEVTPRAAGQATLSRAIKVSQQTNRAPGVSRGALLVPVEDAQLVVARQMVASLGGTVAPE